MKTALKLIVLAAAAAAVWYLVFQWNLNGTASRNLFLKLKGQTLQETGAPGESASRYFWLSSGAYFYVSSTGVGATVQGALPVGDRWRLEYAKDNPTDTDGGYHPQNLFRLVETGEWRDYSEQAYFMIKADELSSSTNRNASNGLMLFNRYQDSDNLYYTGIRVDGAAVIKKKIDGVYYTMAYKQIFPGTYNPETAPDLLPHNEWIGLKTVVSAGTDGAVTLTLYTDVGRTGVWTEALSATDSGKEYGGPPIAEAGYVGIRTDFMDVLFDDFEVSTLPVGTSAAS